MSFNPALPTNRDWVRLLIGDDDPLHEQLADATIDAILVEVLANGASAAGAKYCAASQAGQLVAAGWVAAQAGKVEKQVSKLRIQYGGGGQASALDAYDKYLATLAQQCTHLSLTTPALLKAW